MPLKYKSACSEEVQIVLRGRYSAVKGNGWMGLSPNNTGLTGLGDQIMRKEADLCISLNEFEHYRSQYVRYLQPLKTYP